MAGGWPAGLHVRVRLWRHRKCQETVIFIAFCFNSGPKTGQDEEVGLWRFRSLTLHFPLSTFHLVTFLIPLSTFLLAFYFLRFHFPLSHFSQFQMPALAYSTACAGDGVLPYISSRLSYSGIPNQRLICTGHQLLEESEYGQLWRGLVEQNVHFRQVL